MLRYNHHMETGSSLGHQSPPDKERSYADIWYLQPTELEPPQIRALGHLLYTVVFTDISVARLRRLASASAEPDSALGGPYLDEFAEHFGLNRAVLRRWLHGAALDLATACFATLHDPHEVEKHRSEWWALALDRTLAAAPRVLERGIRAPVVDHRMVLDYAMHTGVLWPDWER